MRARLLARTATGSCLRSGVIELTPLGTRQSAAESRLGASIWRRPRFPTSPSTTSLTPSLRRGRRLARRAHSAACRRSPTTWTPHADPVPEPPHGVPISSSVARRDEGDCRAPSHAPQLRRPRRPAAVAARPLDFDSWPRRRTSSPWSVGGNRSRVHARLDHLCVGDVATSGDIAPFPPRRRSPRLCLVLPRPASRSRTESLNRSLGLASASDLLAGSDVRAVLGSLA